MYNRIISVYYNDTPSYYNMTFKPEGENIWKFTKDITLNSSIYYGFRIQNEQVNGFIIRPVFIRIFNDLYDLKLRKNTLKIKIPKNIVYESQISLNDKDIIIGGYPNATFTIEVIAANLNSSNNQDNQRLTKIR